MNRSQAQEIWFLLKAFGEGVIIQQNTGIWKNIGNDLQSKTNLWIDWAGALNIDLLIDNPEYFRIKPEPEEIWVNETKIPTRHYFLRQEHAEGDIVNPDDYNFIAKRFVEADDE